MEEVVAVGEEVEVEQRQLCWTGRDVERSLVFGSRHDGQLHPIDPIGEVEDGSEGGTGSVIGMLDALRSMSKLGSGRLCMLPP